MSYYYYDDHEKSSDDGRFDSDTDDSDDSIFNYNTSINQYLTVLENKNSIDRPIDKPSTPNTSNLYWNIGNKKHKAFIKTSNCDLYLNLEEYNCDDIKCLPFENRWMKAKKSVSIALSINSKRDLPLFDIIDEIDKIVIKQTLESFKNKEKKIITNFTNCKFYKLSTYFVKDIEYFPIEKRYKQRRLSFKLEVSPENEYELFNVMNKAFYEVAKRFVNDADLKVFHYGRRSY